MQLTLLEPLPRPVQAERLLSLMHRGWEATSEEGRNKVGRVDIPTALWDELPSMLGSFLKEHETHGRKLWGAKLHHRPSLPPDTCLFWSREGVHKATGRLVRPQPPVPPPTVPRPPVRVVWVARKPGPEPSPPRWPQIIVGRTRPAKTGTSPAPSTPGRASPR